MTDSLGAAEYVAGSGITISGANNEVSVKIVELRSGATYADDEIPSAKSVKQTIVDNELVVASALNDLEERKLDASAFTETSAALETLSGEVASKELVVSAALNDLNTRLIEVSGDVTDNATEISGVSDAVENLSTSIVAKQDKLTAGSGITIDSANTISVIINTNSDDWSSGSTGVPATSALAEVLEEIEEVTATALNDLNDRLTELENTPDIYVSGGSYNTTNGVLTINQANGPDVNVTIQAGGSSGGETNVINTVKVNGTALTPDSNKAVDITVPTSLSQLTSAHTHSEYATTGTVNTLNNTVTAHTANTTVHVTDTEKSTWNGKQNAITDLDSIRTSAATQSDWNATSGVAMIKNKPTIPTNLNQLTSAHTHTISEVTNLQSTLNAKVSGITVNNGTKVTPTDGVANLTIDASTVGALPTGTTLDNVADGTTRKLSNYSLTSHTHSEYATTGTVNTLNNTVTAHTGNSDIHVTAADKSTWSGKQDAITDLASIRTSAATQSDWNATSGVAMIKNKPTIPSAPGTLTTTATTAQATATNEALSGNIALHKVSKTGSYNDLNNKPTIPTVSNSTVTLTFNGATVGSFTLNGTGGTIDIGTVIGLPSFSAANNGQILGVVNGQLAWVTPTTIYTGSGTPDSNTGNNGDIYLQTS